MSKKIIYSTGLFFLVSMFLYFFLQKSQTVNSTHQGTFELAARENMLLPLRELQSFVNYRFATERITLPDDLLPADRKNDPWGTQYECRCDIQKFCLHSAGPDKIMKYRPLKPCDDILIFKFCVVDLSTPLPDLDNMMRRFSEPLIAEALLNCDDESYRNSADGWLKVHGYTTSFGGNLNPEVW
jgi:hypothetical protein